MHHVLRADEMHLLPAYANASDGFARCSLVDRAAGSVHMGVGLCSLDADGSVDPHLHSFEESFYVLEGSPALVLDGRAHLLQPGACGVVPVGVRHAWVGPAGGTARWIDMYAPQPRVDGAGGTDTFFVGTASDAGEPAPLDVRDPRTRNFFRLDEGQMELDRLKAGAAVDEPTVSASMATALLAYSGIAVKMLVDQRLDAQLHTMFMVEYEPGGVAHPHDHPLEEAYVILEGEVEAEADGERYALRAGDAFWTGVGCVHAFYNRSEARVRWLETQAPQPPARHSYRFNRDWEYLDRRIDSASQSTAPR
ncbi:MAG TPA: cupin domain-containing protein [Gaiellaceae bacterium]|nr:cupin domain-containing protein [Gaiellaceae bacterium]